MAGTKTDGQRPAVGRSRTLAAAEGGLSCSQQLSQCLSIFMLLCKLVGFWFFFFFCLLVLDGDKCFCALE